MHYNYNTIFIFLTILVVKCLAITVYENDVNFRVDAGSKTCIFESGSAGQVMEVYYQVVDGQHGDLDISFDIIDPQAKKLVSDYKKSQNSVILDLEMDGDYALCLDNTYSLVNSKLVFVYVLVEFKNEPEKIEPDDAEVAVVEADGNEEKEEEIIEWVGFDEEGQKYYVDVADIADSLTRTLNNVVKARRMLDIYGANKARDSYLAFEDTFVVDMWSGLQISLMIVVGMVQVFMIKKLFTCPGDRSKYDYLK